MRAALVIATSLLLCSLFGFSSDQPAPTSKASLSGALVDTPQAAILWQKNGSPREIWLIGLSADVVVWKASMGAKKKQTLRADSGNVQAIQLATGEMFKVNPSTGAFARFDPLKRAFIGEGQTEKSGGPDTLVQEVEGSGTTGDEAIRDALRNAVHEAVGVLVDGEVLVKKEDVISDKVLTYSDGFVTSYKELSRKQKDGLIYVQIRAQVEQRKLLADLRKAGVTLGPADGQGLVASALTRKDALDTASALLSKALADLPNVLTADVRPVNALDYDADTQLLNLSVSVRVDRDKYLAWSDSFAAVLNRVSLAKQSVLLNMLPTIGAGDNLLDWSQAPLGPIVQFGPDLQSNPKSWCLWIALRGDERRRMFRVACYVLDVNIVRALQGTRGQFHVEIALLDAGNDEIAKDVLDPVSKSHRTYWLGWLGTRPRQQVTEFPGQATAALFGTTNIANLAPSINPKNSVNAYVVPRCIAGLDKGNILCAVGLWQTRSLKVAPEVLSRMKEIRGRVVFTPAESSTAGPGQP